MRRDPPLFRNNGILGTVVASIKDRIVNNGGPFGTGIVTSDNNVKSPDNTTKQARS